MTAELVEVGRFCPNGACERYGDIDEAEIIRYGKTAKGTQRYLCKVCGKTFVETTGTLFYGKHTPPGTGWRLAREGGIALDGKLPLTTMGGLKARGHPIGATALYQVCEIVLQLTGRAGENQLHDPRVALMQSVGGAAATVITHIFAL